MNDCFSLNIFFFVKNTQEEIMSCEMKLRNERDIMSSNISNWMFAQFYGNVI